MLDADSLKFNRPRPAFGHWLLKRKVRSDVVGQSAQAAPSDWRFPRDGLPEKISAHLHRCQADGETHDTVEAAELDRRC